MKLALAWALYYPIYLIALVVSAFLIYSYTVYVWFNSHKSWKECLEESLWYFMGRILGLNKTLGG